MNDRARAAAFAIRKGPSPGFTLVELLAAMTVLVLILLMVTQLFDGATRATTQSYRTVDLATEARLTLDRLADDFARMVRRSDIDYKFDKKPGNDAIAFYAEASGYTGSSTGPLRTLAALDYRIHEGTASGDALLNFKLERGARATAYTDMTFSDPPPPYTPGSQTYVAGFPPFNTLPLIAAGDYTVLANQVFRLEFCYLLKNGRFSKTPNPPSDTVNAGGADFRPDPGGFKQVAAFVIAIGMLDARNRVLLGDPKSSSYDASFGKLVAALPDVDPDPTDPNSSSRDILTVWQPAVLKIAARTDTSLASLPRPVTSNIHVFQRYYYWK